MASHGQCYEMHRFFTQNCTTDTTSLTGITVKPQNYSD
jgi:hypothetical protein